MWISNAEHAGVFLVMANVDPSAVSTTRVYLFTVFIHIFLSSPILNPLFYFIYIFLKCFYFYYFLLFFILFFIFINRFYNLKMPSLCCLAGIQRHYLLHCGPGHRGAWDLQEGEQAWTASILYLPSQLWQREGEIKPSELHWTIISLTGIFPNFQLSVGTREKHFRRTRSWIQVCHRHAEWGQDWHCSTGTQWRISVKIISSRYL